MSEDLERALQKAYNMGEATYATYAEVRALQQLDEYQQALLDNWVKHWGHIRMGEKTTIVMLKCINGYEVVGTSACINPADYKLELGVEYALKDALQKLDGVLGFLWHDKQDFNKGE